MLEVLSAVLHPSVLLCTLGGVIMGISFGAMPGLTSTMGVCLLMPLTFSMGPADRYFLWSPVWWFYYCNFD